ncbi:MAG: hypothetical protein BV456_09615 [Thermoplasmata archaeon M8B2D]|nr:MAG: hypothetical protein BV456_09615 [Thermoplasmata archaeon M8B2D]
MKQTPLTSMENRWVNSTKEAFDALVEMGYNLYTDKYLGYEKLEVVSNGIIFQVGAINSTSKQAYYHNGHFYDQPYEEFTITEEKVQFPELEDIAISKSVSKHLLVSLPKSVTWLISEFYGDFKDMSAIDQYKVAKKMYEYGLDVECKLKPKINRKLHENRPLALAIGRWLVEGNSITGVQVNEEYFLQGVMAFDRRVYCILNNGYGEYSASSLTEVSIDDDFIIPEQVLQWMKEYQQEEGIK